MQLLAQGKAGVQSTWQSMRIVFQQKHFAWFSLAHLLVHFAVCGIIMRCGLHLHQVMQMCYLFYFPGVNCVTSDMGCLAISFLSVLAFGWVVGVLYATMLKQLFAYLRGTPISVRAALPDRDLLISLVGYISVHVVVMTVLTVLAVSVSIVLALVLFALWYVGMIVSLPLLVDRQCGVVHAIIDSYKVLAHRFVVVAFAVLTAIAVAYTFFLLLKFMVYWLTWLVCTILSIPVCIHLLIPYILVLVPLILLLWYLMTVGMVLPGVLWERIKS